MTETYSELSREERIAQGLSYEPAIIEAAEWVLNGKSLVDYSPCYDDLLRYIEIRYGLDRDVVGTSLEIAEQRIIRGLQDGEA